MDQLANHILPRSSQPGAADRMRELLARTVQDHMQDQRSNAAAIEEIRKHLEGLEWLVKDAGERESANIAAQIDGLFRRLGDAREAPPRWAEALTGHIEALGGRIEALGEALRAQEERLAALEQGGARLRQGMEAAAGRFSRLDKAIAELSQRAGYLDKEVSAIKGRADQGFTALAAKVEQGTAAVSAALEQSSARLEQNLTGMAEIEAAVSKIVDDAQASMAIRLSSLEETLLTLAEALLRPGSRDAATAAPAGDHQENGKG